MDTDTVYISALQHFLFCPRQCALIHIEQMWEENRLTAEGRLLHTKTDKQQGEKRKGIRTVTNLPVASEVFRISGIADVVELHEKNGRKVAYPVEYKRGRPKKHRADEVQLCAQALCLEEMLGCSCLEGALYYGKTRRRMVVSFDDELRGLTREVISATHDLLESGKTPHASYDPRRCDNCSLVEPCQPRLSNRPDVNSWLASVLED